MSNQEVLLIVHLSSIDSYISFYDIDAGVMMINDIRFAIAAHRGPIVILDQGWSHISNEAKHLRKTILAMKVLANLTIFHHDEMTDLSPWQDGMNDLATLLNNLHLSSVRIGGFWASQNEDSGCVHEVQRQLLARNISCYIDTSICAFEEADSRQKGSTK